MSNVTPAERITAERDRIQEESGFYVTPCRMAHLMDAASKIANILVRTDTNICYAECRFILRIVSGVIADISKEDLHNDNKRQTDPTDGR